MEPNEIRGEVERRKQRARDLKIREVLWDLEKHSKHCRAWLRDDPLFAARLTYPGVVLSDSEVRFSIAQTTFVLTYKESAVSPDTKRGTLVLKLNAENVFEFSVDKTTEFGEFEPIFTERLGEVVRFIEGPWIVDVIGFWREVNAHSDSVWKERNNPREAKEIEDLKKRFGL
jgi:hypothetical protein